MNKVTLTIDDQQVSVESGISALEACLDIGIKIPTLCYRRGLPGYGACRLCVVEVGPQEWSRMRASCTLLVREKMLIRTNTERVQRTRRIMAELLMARCPDAVAVKEVAAELGVTDTRFPKKSEDCILCGLCTRVCSELMKIGAIDFRGRGDTREVGPAYDKFSPICTACGACRVVCPTHVDNLDKVTARQIRPAYSEFDAGLIERPAIYIPFPQALPNVPVIDRENCMHFLTGACKACEVFCPAGAIDYSQEDEVVEIDVGAAILSPGYCIFDAGKKLELGYAWHQNVITGLQFERILSASGPYGGKIVRPSDMNTPKKIAFIQCVGSRDAERNYCSSVCCMYATKEAIISKEHEEDLECNIFYMDMRAFGKGFDTYFERAKELGVIYTRCRPSSVEEIEETKNLRIGYVDENDGFVTKEFDLVVLSTGLCPPAEVRELAETFGVEIDSNGFAVTSGFDSVESSRPGVYVCGPFSEPKDIPETVMEASSASAKAMALLAEERGTLVTQKEWPSEKDISGQKPRIGVFVCHCGRNIGGVVNVPEVRDYVRTLPNVILAQDNLYTCSIDTQESIKKAIEEHNLNRVVVASCTPRTHEPLFRETVRGAGLNQYLFEMANIRDQCSWVHMHDPEEATRKSKELVRMAVTKASLLEPLYSVSIPVNSGALVIGGGVGGMTAAYNLAEQGFEVNLIERDEELGGNLRNVYSLLSGEDVQKKLGEIIRKINSHPNIKVWLGTSIESIDGFVGNFKTKVKQEGDEAEIEHGAVIVATGAKEDTPTEYMYGSDERVVTQCELEEMLAKGDFNARRVVMIQCVGSREEERMYCSRICCSQAIKNALKIKENYPQTDVFILYREIRTYGFREKYYTAAREKGIRFVRYEVEHKPDVFSDNDRLRIEIRDPVLGRTLLIDSDLLVLAPVIVPRDDTEDLARMLKAPLTREKFFLEAHMKLRPVDCSVDGVFLTGMAHAPKNVEETIAQAEAAASRAATIISKEEYTPEAIVALVDEDVCAACGVCVSVCSYDAPEIITVRGKKVSRINKVLCKGCGACTSACPSSAVQQLGFRTKQLSEMVSASLE
ncbi:MAG TPA: FAD-dependent oxidoreductase [Spirochaetes bacterium]|nr:FAD-dependent oxidoreductase [Spirochaetota bacterium]